MNTLITPYGGGELSNRLARYSADFRLNPALELPRLVLNLRQQCDLELLLNGAFSPLTGFLGVRDYVSVLEQMRLSNGLFWPVPVVLDVAMALAAKLAVGDQLLLTDQEYTPLATLAIDSIWQPDKQQEALAIYGTDNPAHPGVATLYNDTQPVYLGGKVTGWRLPEHYYFQHLRQTPAQLREQFLAKGFTKIIGFQTRNPIHKVHYQLTLHAMQMYSANLLLHPAVGITQPGDVNHYSRVHCYQKVLPYYPNDAVQLSLLPLAMRMAGPREALWHAIIRQNYGCSHFIIGRDHAGPVFNGDGFYAPYACHELARQYQSELDIELILMSEMVYVPKTQGYYLLDQVQEQQVYERVSGKQIIAALQRGEAVPDWASFPEVVTELQKLYQPESQQGFTLLLTGLSAAGKSSLAKALFDLLMERDILRVSLLDGDVIRHCLSSDLGFDKASRDKNIERLGLLAGEITKHGGIAICAPIAPYAAARRRMREYVSQYGGFIEVYVATPLAVCEARDPKGWYAKARAGKIQQFTGIDADYEVPQQPELVLDLSVLTPAAAALQVLAKCQALGYLAD